MKEKYDITLPELPIEDRGGKLTNYAINIILIVALLALIGLVVAYFVSGINLPFITTFSL